MPIHEIAFFCPLTFAFDEHNSIVAAKSRSGFMLDEK